MDSTKLAVIMACLLSISEALSLCPKIAANGVFQLVFQIIKSLAKKDNSSASSSS